MAKRPIINVDLLPKNFEQAVMFLPAASDPVEELEWIASHPAMTRANRRGSGRAPTPLTVEDAFHPRHGHAPSRRAVNMLGHWVEHPAEFHKQWMAKYRKDEAKQDDDNSVETEADMEVLTRLLKQIKEGMKSTGN